MPGLTDTPHIQPKYWADTGVPGHTRHVGLARYGPQ